jgi:hypothetical protein
MTRVIAGVFAILGTAGSAAQTQTPTQPLPASVRVGSVNVASCSPSDDPDYGLVKEKPILIGGGPLYMAARQRRFLQSLRGPEGQPVAVPNGVGSFPANDADHTILDVYTVSYEGHGGIQLFMDAYHYGEPHVPRGFTCSAPLPTVLGPPPVDGFKVTDAVQRLAIEQGSAREFTPIPLTDSSGAVRGALLDQFRVIAVAARAAVSAGAPLDPAKLPAELTRQGLIIVAHPLTCGARTIPAASAAIVAQQAQAPPMIGVVSDAEQLKKLLPGVPLPPGSIAVRYGLANPRPTDSVRISYQEGCDGAAADIDLALKSQPPRLVNGPPARAPLGSVGLDAALYFQALIDFEGRFLQPYALIGAKPIADVGRETLGQWRAEPGRINGAPVVTPIVVQIELR